MCSGRIQIGTILEGLAETKLRYRFGVMVWTFVRGANSFFTEVLCGIPECRSLGEAG